MLYQEGLPAVFQEDCSTIPGNSQRCTTEYKFSKRRQRRSWGPRITPDAGMGVVLEAGPGVAHVAVTGFQGIPDCVARYKFPR